MSTPAASDKNSPYFQATVPGTSHTLAFTNTAAYTANFSLETTIVEVFSTTDAWVRVVESTDVGVAAPVVAGSTGLSVFCPGGIVRFIGIPFKKTVFYKMSIIRDSTNGTAYVNEAV